MGLIKWYMGRMKFRKLIQLHKERAINPQSSDAFREMLLEWANTDSIDDAYRSFLYVYKTGSYRNKRKKKKKKIQ